MTPEKQDFQPNDIVKVLPHNIDLQAIQGKRGIVYGISVSEEDSNLVAYSVYFPPLKESWFIFEKDLESTVMQSDPNYFKTDLSIRVYTDPNTRNSEIIQ